MDRSKTISWVVSVCALYIRLSQAKTLGILIASAMRSRRISLANLGRQMTGNVKHQIKRAWRSSGPGGSAPTTVSRSPTPCVAWWTDW
jgi:hypothetical protein